MLTWLLDWARSQSHEEVRRQSNLINQVEPHRRILVLLPFAVAASFLPLWICSLAAVICSTAELAAIWLLGRTDPRVQPGSYLSALAFFAVSQVAFMGTSALAWQSLDGFAKAFAVGMYFINLVNLSTVRSVHFPLSVTTQVTASLVALVGNSYFWISTDDWTGLAISTLCILPTTYFVMLTTTVVNKLHHEMSRDRRAAEAANEAKSRFLAQMSHELRTPLNAILGMGYAELTTAQEQSSKDRMATLVQSARSLSVLLNDILDLSAVEAGQLPIRPTVVNIRAETNATLALFRQQIFDANMAMNVGFAEGVPEYALMDGQRFRQCLSNVMSNAIKYSQQGTIDIALSAPAPGQIDVVVSDNGPGVPERLRERIFEPFHRGESVVVGTGLGLSISRTLARRMGGDLVLLPGGNGARFMLSVALQPADPPEAALPEQPLADLTGRRILVVDDIATNRLVAMTYLRIMGANPAEAASGPAALILIAADPPDAVLLDMLMPDMDGMATLRRIRALPGLAGKLPVLAMTADATDERRRHYLSSGLDGYVSKPLAPEILGQAILDVLPVASV